METKGVPPLVAGVPAIWDDAETLIDSFSHWRCPHCGANLAGENRICLNACGMSVAAYRTFQAGINAAYQKVKRDDEVSCRVVLAREGAG